MRVSVCVCFCVCVCVCVCLSLCLCLFVRSFVHFLFGCLCVFCVSACVRECGACARGVCMCVCAHIISVYSSFGSSPPTRKYTAKKKKS